MQSLGQHAKGDEQEMKPLPKWLQDVVTSTGWPNVTLAAISIILAAALVFLLHAVFG
jgi:hypothetical protein